MLSSLPDDDVVVESGFLQGMLRGGVGTKRPKTIPNCPEIDSNVRNSLHRVIIEVNEMIGRVVRATVENWLREIGSSNRAKSLGEGKDRVRGRRSDG